MKNLQGLVSFVEAAAAGSFTAAAQRLELTPAAVSKNVARLEAELQVRLFHRTTRRLSLTSEGAAFLAQARLGLRTLDDAVGAVARRRDEVVGRVRISVGASFGRRYLLPLLPALAEAHPALELELNLDNRPVDLVAEGFDIGVRGGFVRDSSLVARRVCRLPVVLVAAPDYLARHGVPESVEALRAHRLLAVRHSNGVLSTWRFRKDGAADASRRGARIELEPPARVVCSDPECLVDLSLAGDGICQTGLHHVLPHLEAGRLQRVLPTLHDPDEREVVLHYPHRRYLTPRVRVVVDALLAHLKAQRELHLDPAVLPAAWNASAAPQGAARRRNTSRSGSDAPASKA